jgi:hypothetical protein
MRRGPSSQVGGFTRVVPHNTVAQEALREAAEADMAVERSRAAAAQESEVHGLVRLSTFP